MGSEAGFGSVEETADVLVVLGDDEQGYGDFDGDEEGCPIGVALDAIEEPGEERKAGRAEDRGQGDVAAGKEDKSEDGDGGQGGERGGNQEDAEAGGYAFASLEAEPDGEDVAEDGAKGRKAAHVERRGVGNEEGSEETTERDGRATFEYVEEEGGGAESLAAGAKNVGGADVAAAGVADVLMAKEADEQIPGGDGAEQVSRRSDKQTCKDHVEGEFNRLGRGSRGLPGGG